MRLKDVSRFFDKELAYDGYTGTFVFKCQFSSFDDSAGDGSTNRRRGMSTAPSVVIPARGCITLGAQRWLVGGATDDSFQGVAMRKNYNLKRVDHALRILTATGAANGASGTLAYAQLHYFKDTSNSLNDAEYDTFWNVFMHPDEPVTQGTFFRDQDGIIYRVRQTYAVTEGFRIAQTDQLDSDALQVAVLEGSTYDPVADTTTGTTTTGNVVQLDTSKFYRNRLPNEAVQRGDRAVMFPDSTPVTVGMVFTMQGKSWRIVTVEPESDAQACVVRLA